MSIASQAFPWSEAEYPQGAGGRWHEVLKWNGTPTGCWMRCWLALSSVCFADSFPCPLRGLRRYAPRGEGFL